MNSLVLRLLTQQDGTVSSLTEVYLPSCQRNVETIVALQTASKHIQIRSNYFFFFIKLLLNPTWTFNFHSQRRFSSLGRYVTKRSRAKVACALCNVKVNF